MMKLLSQLKTWIEGPPGGASNEEHDFRLGGFTLQVVALEVENWRLEGRKGL